MVALWLIINPGSYEQEVVQEEIQQPETQVNESAENLATTILEKLEIKGRAPKTGYNRSEEFYKNWPNINGCSLRQIIIKREFGESAQLAEMDAT